MLLEAVIAWPNLCTAWEMVADNRGAPGIDHMSIARFRRNWEDNLRRLQQQVQTGRYRPSKLRRVTIPKPTGGQRLLQIPIVADRVLQRATLNVIERLFEPHFLTCSFGYRPGRGVRDAVKALLSHRERGLTWVLDADIDDCFDSLDHDILRGLIEARITDYRLRELIDGWLLMGRRLHWPERGIALGMPISPLLCNVYLHELDRRLMHWRWALVRYADDFVICCATQAQAEDARNTVVELLADMKLRLEPNKTRVTSFEEGFAFLGVRFESDRYVFQWQEKRIEVRGPIPHWLWAYAEVGYGM